MLPEPVVTVRAPPPVTLVAGETAEARFVVVVAGGYHVQANPASGEFLVPLQLDIRGRNGVRLTKPLYPPGRPYHLEGTSSDLMTYEGTFEIVVPLKGDELARLGEHILRGVLRFQACDTRTCLFPQSVPVALVVRVVATHKSPVEVKEL